MQVIVLVLLYSLHAESGPMVTLHYETVAGLKSHAACVTAGERKIASPDAKKKYKGYACRVYKKHE